MRDAAGGARAQRRSAGVAQRRRLHATDPLPLRRRTPPRIGRSAGPPPVAPPSRCTPTRRPVDWLSRCAFSDATTLGLTAAAPYPRSTDLPTVDGGVEADEQRRGRRPPDAGACGGRRRGASHAQRPAVRARDALLYSARVGGARRRRGGAGAPRRALPLLRAAHRRRRRADRRPVGGRTSSRRRHAANALHGGHLSARCRVGAAVDRDDRRRGDARVRVARRRSGRGLAASAPAAPPSASRSTAAPTGTRTPTARRSPPAGGAAVYVRMCGRRVAGRVPAHCRLRLVLRGAGGRGERREHRRVHAVHAVGDRRPPRRLRGGRRLPAPLRRALVDLLGAARAAAGRRDGLWRGGRGGGGADAPPLTDGAAPALPLPRRRRERVRLSRVRPPRRAAVAAPPRPPPGGRHLPAAPRAADAHRRQVRPTDEGCAAERGSLRCRAPTSTRSCASTTRATQSAWSSASTTDRTGR